MKFKNSIINIASIVLGILLSAKFTALYQLGIFLFYEKEKGIVIPKFAFGAIIILLHIIITQGIIFLIYKKFKKKVLIVISLVNIILTILVAAANIILLIA